ncbi:MAG TPA: 4Fe-4S dicluster domain-containing protein [Ktedonobacterales bacterium]|nr:4Fe-4S dicluster domain-containing protein [Ktedonobacterales bacterium]
MPELRPAPLTDLLRRAYYEPKTQGTIFDLPLREFYRPDLSLDTSVKFHGLPAATPLGPAAGPHDQLAQNVALAWLSGSRIIELKTVQILDRLVINRPCIDVTNVGFNIEWSQELKLEQSLREYAKASMLVDILREENVLGLPPEAIASRGAIIYDMSVGYDLKGIQSPQVRAFIEGVKDASAIINDLRSEIPDEYARYHDFPFRTDLVKTATLSTFHGCPKDEIERICRFLLGEVGVHTIIKLNPVQIGREELEGILYDLLGYTHLQVNPKAYETGLSLNEAIEIVQRLEPLARERGLNVGVKFSNTLEVRNTLGRLPDEVMYLSGQPLHVIAVSLVEAWRQRMGTRYPVSFAAGIDRRNVPNAVALGLVPITASTDLLRPKGYGRLEGYLKELEASMRKVGAITIPDYIIKARGQAQEAIEAIFSEASQEGINAAAWETLKGNLLADLNAPQSNLGAVFERAASAMNLPGVALETLYDLLVKQAVLLNTPIIAGETRSDPRYTWAQNSKEPRKIESHLFFFDCLSCDKCLPVCPNDANFVFEVEPVSFTYRDYRLTRGSLLPDEAHQFYIEKRTQIGNFADFCNECGNCDTFCPEYGGPFVEKPSFFGSKAAWEQQRQHDGFWAERQDGADRIFGRIQGREYSLEVQNNSEQAVFADGKVALTLRLPSHQLTSWQALDESLARSDASREPFAPAGLAPDHVVEMKQYFRLEALLRGVLRSNRVNCVNVKCLPTFAASTASASSQHTTTSNEA